MSTYSWTQLLRFTHVYMYITYKCEFASKKIEPCVIIYKHVDYIIILYWHVLTCNRKMTRWLKYEHEQWQKNVNIHHYDINVIKKYNHRLCREKTAVAVTTTTLVNTPALSDWSRAKSYVDPARKVNKPPSGL